MTTKQQRRSGRTPRREWGPIEADWGADFHDFDADPFGDGRTLATEAEQPPVPRPRRSAPRSGADVRRVETRRADARRDETRRVETRTRGPEPRRPEKVARSPRPRLRVVEPVEHPRAAGRHQAIDRVKTLRRRRRTWIAILVVLLLVITGRLVHLQVMEPDRYVEAGERQRLRTVTIRADRGRILDRQGHDLALSVLRPNVFADPSLIEDPAGTASRLAPYLRMNTAELTELLSRDTRYVLLRTEIDDALASRIVELDLAGIHLLQSPARFTPSGDLARSVIGRVSPDQAGSTGMEFIFDDVLTGTPGEVRYERAADGSTIAAAGQSRIPARAGSDVVLTIDRSLQFEAERLLADQVEQLGADGGMVVVSDPRTGELLAMANVVTLENGEAVPSSANLAVTSVFEPGSVNKVITIAAALEEGLVEPETTRIVPWRHQVSDHEFTDDHWHASEPMSVTEILAESSNVGTIMLGQDLGKERIDRYLRDFGFGSHSALDFPNESRGLLLDPEKWSGTSIGSIPIGQGIAVTAVQMLSAYNVIANDGVYVEPRLVDATVDADGTRHDLEPAETTRVVSEQTATEVRAMLAEAVATGTGTRAQVDGYTVAGKTGTARKPQDTGTYQDRAGNYHYVAAFTGMVPAENPALTIIVVIDEPSATIYGGTAAAPVFRDLAQFALSRFRIPPTGAGD